jgi:hypothetical protein
MKQKKKLPEPIKQVLQKAGDSLSKIKLKKVFGSKEPIVNEYTKLGTAAGTAIAGAAYGKEIAQAAKRGVKNIKKGVKAAKSDVKYGVEKIKKGVKTAVNKVPSGKRRK